MNISLLPDGPNYTGTPVEIVRRLRADSHGPRRDVDGYMRGVIEYMGGDEVVPIDLSASTVEERCEAFLAGSIRYGFMESIFHADGLDAATIRVLRKARELSQEKLANLLGVSTMTVNRWESGDNQPSEASQAAIERELFNYFIEDEPEHDPGVVALTSAVGEPKRTLRASRQRARSGHITPIHAAR